MHSFTKTLLRNLPPSPLQNVLYLLVLCGYFLPDSCDKVK